MGFNSTFKGLKKVKKGKENKCRGRKRKKWNDVE
jgi:hypothetical protein